MFFPALHLRIRALFLRRRLERDLNEEIEFHLALASERQVPRRFGNVTAVRERTRQIWTLGVVEDLWQDLRYAATNTRLPECSRRISDFSTRSMCSRPSRFRQMKWVGARTIRASK